jgi:hypothetical protein
MNLKLLIFLAFLLILTIEFTRQNENFEDGVSSNDTDGVSSNDTDGVSLFNSMEVEPEDPKAAKNKIDAYNQQTIDLQNVLNDKVKEKSKQKCSEITFNQLKGGEFPQLKGIINSGLECSSRKGTWNRETNLCCDAESAKKMIEEHTKNIKKRIKEKNEPNSSGYADMNDEDETNVIDGVSEDEFEKSPENIKKALVLNNPQFMSFHSTSFHSTSA